MTTCVYCDHAPTGCICGGSCTWCGCSAPVIDELCHAYIAACHAYIAWSAAAFAADKRTGTHAAAEELRLAYLRAEAAADAKRGA